MFYGHFMAYPIYLKIQYLQTLTWYKATALEYLGYTEVIL